MSFKVNAIVHSIKAVKEVEIIEKRGDNDYLAKVGDVVCTAIFVRLSASTMSTMCTEW